MHDDVEPVFKRSKWGTNHSCYNAQNPVGVDPAGVRALRADPATGGHPGRRCLVSGIRNWRRRAGSLLAWWAVVTLVLVLSSTALGRPVTFVGCGASAVLLIAVGEAGNGLRQRLRHRTRRTG